MGTEFELERLREQLAARDEVIKVQAALIAELTTKLERLDELVRKQGEMLARDSANSNLPPSSDGPGGSKGRRKKTKGRKRGGQKGHKGSHRRLVAPEQVDHVVDMFPARCEECAKYLPKTVDAYPKRHQHTELEPLALKVTEYRRHSVVCECGCRTRAVYDDDVIPRMAFGPRLMSAVVLLTGVYHLSRVKAAQLMWDLLGVRISTGSISNIERRMSEAVAPSVDEAWDEAMRAPVKHTDGTSWLQSGTMLALWTVATVGATVFKIIDNGRADTLRSQVLTQLRGVLVSDRATALKFWAMERRQICWAHLLRKFVSFSERDGPAGTRGRELLDCTTILFTYWSDFQNGLMTRAQFVMRMAPLRADFEHILQQALAANIKGFSGSCGDIWDHRQALWTFVEQDGVEPTNNHAERELRGFVLWRKRSFGTQSDRGNRFAERLMTIAHTARKQSRNVLDFLVACCEHTDGQPVPSLFATI